MEQEKEISVATNKEYKNRLLIDYLQVTFSDFNIMKFGNGGISKKDYSYIIGNMDLLNKLLKILGCNKEWNQLDNFNGLNAFSHGKIINEHIKISWGSIHNGYGDNYNEETGEITPVIGDYILMLTISGQGCREFEQLGGNWLEFFQHIVKNHSNYKIKRLDLAYDNFTQNEVNIKDLIDLVRKKSYISKSTKWTVNMSSENKLSNMQEGETLTIGSPGRNQVVIYDKLAENLKTKKEEFYGTRWDRYEIRLKNDAARNLVLTLVAKNKNLDSKDFVETYFELLTKMFEPKDPNDKKSRMTRRKTWQPWLDFTNNVKKSDIKFSEKKEISLEQSTKWYFTATPKVLAAMLLTANDTLPEFLLKIIKFFVHKNFDKTKSVMHEQVKTFLKDKNIDLNPDKAWDILISRMQELEVFVKQHYNVENAIKNDARNFDNLTDVLTKNEKIINEAKKQIEIIKSMDSEKEMKDINIIEEEISRNLELITITEEELKRHIWDKEYLRLEREKSNVLQKKEIVHEQLNNKKPKFIKAKYEKIKQNRLNKSKVDNLGILKRKPVGNNSVQKVKNINLNRRRNKK